MKARGMEGLKKLEQLHMLMTLVETNNATEIPKDHHDIDSHRFLSNFALFLTEPCGELTLDDKCRLISQHLPKISDTCREAELKLPGCQTGYHMDCLILADPSPSESEDLCCIGLDAMQRANSTLEDFCRSYFMFHGMDPNNAKAIFRYLPVLSFTESYMYQLDTLNERMLNTIGDRGVGHGKSSNMEVIGRWKAESVQAFESNPFRPLLYILEQNGLLSERIREELKCGEEYWALERKLCFEQENTVKVSVSAEDVMRAIHLKSFDYRVLNLLMYEVRKEKVNELHMEFLSASELLVEIGDDLFDYEEDVLENNFNILRMFVRLYGTSKASTMLAKYIAEVEENYGSLLKALNPQLSHKYQRRCEEATREGGSMSESPLGSWTIPILIENEEQYRLSCAHQHTA